MTSRAVRPSSRKPGKEGELRSPRRSASAAQASRRRPCGSRCASDPRSSAFSTRFPTKRAGRRTQRPIAAALMKRAGELLSEPPRSSRSICSHRRCRPERGHQSGSATTLGVRHSGGLVCCPSSEGARNAQTGPGIVDFRNRVRPLRAKPSRARAGQKPDALFIAARIAALRSTCLPRRSREICSSCANPGNIVSPAAPTGFRSPTSPRPPPSSSRWASWSARHHRLRPLQLRADERPSPRLRERRRPHLRSWLRHADGARARSGSHPRWNCGPALAGERAAPTRAPAQLPGGRARRERGWAAPARSGSTSQRECSLRSGQDASCARRAPGRTPRRPPQCIPAAPLTRCAR